MATCTLMMVSHKNERMVDIMKNEIKVNLIKLEQLEEIAGRAETDYDREPENAEYEEAFDRAYQNEYNAFMLVASQISEFVGIDIKTAREIVRVKRDELKRILA